LAVYKIVEMGDDILREKARAVPKITPNIIKLLNNMTETMHHFRGVGLAAPQIGVSKRVVVVDVGEGLVEMINPELFNFAGQDTDTEGCLSIPGLMGDVARASSVEVKCLDRHGKEQVFKANGYLARAVQHEVDHLNGILFIDKADNVRKIKQKEEQR